MSRSLGVSGIASKARTSEQAWIGPGDEEVGAIVRKIRTRAAQMTGVFNEDLFERLQVARYMPGQEYRPHHDACLEQCDRMGLKRVRRLATFLVYLTDEFEGGGTLFPATGARVRPVRGNAVLFYNTFHTGAVIPDSLHAGEPVLSGVKWIANCWVWFDG